MKIWYPNLDQVSHIFQYLIPGYCLKVKVNHSTYIYYLVVTLQKIVLRGALWLVMCEEREKESEEERSDNALTFYDIDRAIYISKGYLNDGQERGMEKVSGL